MRQKDDLSFAQLINRVQLGHQMNIDITSLSSHIMFLNDANYPHEALHISTNRDNVTDTTA